MNITPKQKKILALAQAGGNDAQLFLLEELQKLEEKMEKMMENMPEMSDEEKIEKTAIKLAVKIADVQKGDKGDEGDKGDTGERGEKGDKGDTGEKGDKGDNGINGQDGEDGNDGKDGLDGSPDTPIQIAEKLETLKGKDRLDKSAIDGLDEEIKALDKKFSEGRPIFGPGKTKVYLKDLSSLLDGSTKTFHIGSHFGITGVWGSSAPFVFRPTIDYTEVGQNIVFSSDIDASISLVAGQQLIVQYLK